MKLVSTLIVAAALSLPPFPRSFALDNGLALTPQMGWNSWNHFGCHIDEELIRDTAKALESTGLRSAGYEYVNLDDCWQAQRRDGKTHKILADPDRFPGGLRALADELHAQHFKFGVYSDAGAFTCERRPGSWGHEVQDAQTYAEWHVDYLKYDNCFNLGLDVHVRYNSMRDALNATGRPILYSMCEWGYKDPATWASNVGNSWRTTVDITPTWKSIMSIADQNDRWHEYAGPGHWNDPDMLEVGNGDLTVAEQKSHFTLWAVMKSPLLLGNDIRDISQETLDIIMNKELIAINQDPLGVQAHKVAKDGDLEVWAGPLDGGDYVVVLLNRSDTENEITAKWRNIGIRPLDQSMNVRDLWKHEDIGVAKGYFSAQVESHSVLALRLTPVSGPSESSNLRESNTTSTIIRTA